MRRLKNNLFVLTAACTLFVTSCSGDRTVTKLQYNPDMADNPTVKPQEDYLDPPEHSIAKNAILYPADIAVAEKEFRNPLPPSPRHEELGEQAYGRFCAHCHGAEGKGAGTGTLTNAYPLAAVPDITRADLKERKDGFFFMKMTQGGPMMPALGHQTTPTERWQMVTFLRSLQNKGQK